MRNTKLNTITGEASCLTTRLETSPIETSSINFLIFNFCGVSGMQFKKYKKIEIASEEIWKNARNDNSQRS